jgi:hypothetical protein
MNPRAILGGHDLGPFRPRSVPQLGFWSMAHEARTDGSMRLGSLFLRSVGSGRWSVDAPLARRRSRAGSGP